MRVLIIALCCLALLSCQKEKLESAPGQGKWKYSCTIREYTASDTIRNAITELDNYYFQVGPFDEWKGVFTLTLYVDEILAQHLVISKRIYDEKYINSTLQISSRRYENNVENGYNLMGLHVNGQPYPYPDTPYMNIVDYPFKGWNRFMKIE